MNPKFEKLKRERLYKVTISGLPSSLYSLHFFPTFFEGKGKKIHVGRMWRK
jgi:hypothetical protein